MKGVEVVGQGTDVFIDGPLVVIKDGDETLGRLGDVVEGFQRGTAGKGGITGDGDDIEVVVLAVACGTNA